MNVAEKERIIAQVVWGYVSATIITQDGKPLSVILHPPTPKEQAKAAMVYSTQYQCALTAGLATEDDIINDMITLGSWDSQTDVEIDGLYKDIHKIRRGLLDFVFNKTKLEQARTLLRRAESALLDRLSKKHNLIQGSAEAHALNCQQRYLIGHITETEDGNPLWRTENDFEKDNDIDMIIQLCEIFFKQSCISTKLIRELARSQQWRAYWEIAKNTGHLFDGSVTSWSSNQRELAHWSSIYDSVYNAYERPSKDVIEDDDLLDSWFIRQSEKVEGKNNNNIAPKPHKRGRNEEFIMADKSGAQGVYNMNDPGTRAKIRARQQLLSKMGSVKEQDMPDSQREMRQQLVEKQRKHVKDIRHR